MHDTKEISINSQSSNFDARSPFLGTLKNPFMVTTSKLTEEPRIKITRTKKKLLHVLIRE